MKIFRWWGVFVFPVIIALIALCYYLFAERLIKHIVEQAGTAMVGAEVNLDKVTLDWSAAKISLVRLQVTNADAPTHNLIEIKTIVADLDMKQLLWLRAHVDNVAISGISFDTIRERAGEVEKSDDKGGFDLLPQMTTFDWDSLADQSGWKSLFDNLHLDSLKAVDDLRSDLKTAETELKAKIDALPNNDVLKGYEERLKALTTKLEGDKLTRALQLVERGKQLDKLRKELKLEAEKVKAIETQYKASKTQLQAQYLRVKQAPEKDINKVVDQLAVELPGTDQLISRVLGPELNGRLQQGNALYQSASPWIEKARVLAGQNPDAPPPPARFKGIDVHFIERDPQPSFWLKTAKVDGVVNALGNVFAFDGQLHDVSDNPDAIAKPITVDLQGKAQNGGDAKLALMIDQRRASAGQTLQFHLREVPLTTLAIANDKQFNLSIASAKLSAQIDGQFQAEQALLKGAADISQLQLNVSSSSQQKFVQAVLNELAKTDAFDLQFSWQRQGAKQTRELRSSLDDIAKRAVKNVVRTELESKKAQVKAQLRERANAELAKLELDWSSLAALEPLLGDKLKRLNEMVDKAKKP